ncbi:MAG: M24 family metallopeptidase [Acidimicrobiales bacterium]
MELNRLVRARKRMTELGVDVCLLSVGADLPYLIGYEAMPLERLTMLVLPREGEATLVVPRLEAPRVEVPSVAHDPDGFRLLAWDETDDPVALVAGLMGAANVVAIGDHTWARFVIELQAHVTNARWVRASEVTGSLRAVKSLAEIKALAAASAAADRVANALQNGDIALVGRSEADVSAEIGRRLIAEGHRKVNFAIVAAGANAASPHHEASDHVIEDGQVVLCDFGGTMPDGYCSDITRCVHIGEPSSEFADLYSVLQEAQAAAVVAAAAGTAASEVDAVARRLIASGGYGELFIHRIGHGIGLDAHEDPYLVEGNDEVLLPGHVFSIEPGIYVPGRFGARIEDIVVATNDGSRSLNTVSHDLVVLDS